jgi:hypothetical protein
MYAIHHRDPRKSLLTLCLTSCMFGCRPCSCVLPRKSVLETSDEALYEDFSFDFDGPWRFVSTYHLSSKQSSISNPGLGLVRWYAR